MKKRLVRGTNTLRDHFEATQEYSGTAISITKNTAVQRICRLPRSAEDISSLTALGMYYENMMKKP